MSKKKADEGNSKIVAKNRRAHYDYEFLETYDAGVVLEGSEVKSIRVNNISIVEAYIAFGEHTLEIINWRIPEYKNSGFFAHKEKRKRQLLLHGSEIKKCRKMLQEKSITAVPLMAYFNHKGILKIKFAIARGKKMHDKRQSIKERDWNREQGKILKHSRNE